MKDRAALAIIKDAEAKGLLKPGGVIVEGTAGNTGIGLALVGNARGYRTVIVIPGDPVAGEEGHAAAVRRRAAGGAGGSLQEPDNYVHVSERLAKELAKTEPNGVLLGQPVRQRRQPPAATTTTTGPEIWEQTDGKVDGFICAIGTGGTLSGVGIFLKERNPKIRIGLADPMGAALYNYFKHGELKAEGSSITEGIGQGRITKNVEGTPVDVPYQIPDEEALPIIFDLLKHEGLCLGGSSGINVAGAIRLARSWGRARPSSPSSATTAPAIRASCSIRRSCARRTCRCRTGCSAICRILYGCKQRLDPGGRRE